MLLRPINLSLALALATLVSCGGEEDASSNDPFIAHRSATDALFGGIEQVVETLRTTASGELAPGQAQRRIAELAPALTAAAEQRRGLGPAVQPEVVEHYAELEPKRKRLFEEFNQLCLRLKGENELLKAAQGPVFAAIQALVAAPQ